MLFTYAGRKRLLDLVLASTLLILALPAMAVVAVAVRASSPGPALFVQARSGQGGRPIHVIKFRTMCVTTRPQAGRETQPDDPRITPVGAWLRHTGLDELPQLVNVLRGDMSLVGPRPLLKWENDACDARQSRRLDVLPGITGLSQVNGRNRIEWAARVEWDLEYVRRASLWLDLKILVRTVGVVLFGQNAYRASPPKPAGQSPAAAVEADLA
jgi:lipopolysaccharide/colanic/teichoic acid biosynthesis glycosyltransferase